jgi:hypothetical protein
MARCVALLAALVPLAGTATAFAQRPSREKADSGTLLYQKTTRYIFEEEEVPVELSRPDTTWVDSRLGSLFDSLIHVREHFMPEMVRSCEDL